MDAKTRPYICCLPETHFRPRDVYRLKVKGWKKILYRNEKIKQYFYQKKIDFKIKTVKRDKEGWHVMIKGSVLGEDITIVNTCAPT